MQHSFSRSLRQSARSTSSITNGKTVTTDVQRQTTFVKRLAMRLIAPFVPDEQL